MTDNRWANFTPHELIDIIHAAWAEDAEGAMGDDIRKMLPEITAELEQRGYTMRGGNWYRPGFGGNRNETVA